MFENFGERGRHTVVLAQAEARELQHHYRVRLSLGADAVEPEHLLLALVRDDGGVANRILTRLGVDPETVRGQVVRAGADPPRDD